MCDTEILEPWESGRQKGKVNAAVGSMQRQGAIPGKGETEGHVQNQVKAQTHCRENEETGKSPHTQREMLQAHF